MLHKGYILCGQGFHLAKWINAFPNLKHLIEASISYNGILKDVHMEMRKRQGLPELILVPESLSESHIAELKNEYSIHFIEDFVLEQLTASTLLPSKLRLEASTICQLNCSGCYMRKNSNGSVGVGFLSFNNFKKLVDENTCIREIELSNSGEIFLNPDLIKIIHYSFLKGIKLTAINGVNFNDVSDEQIEALVKYRFHSLSISLDGASQETYGIYRRKGDFDKVIHNIKKLLAVKKRYASNFPQIVWQYILMEHNESEVKVAKEMANDLGIPIWYKLNWDDHYIPHNREMLMNVTNLHCLTRSEYCCTNHKAYLGAAVCSQMFLSPQVNWDGRLLGCCEVFLDDYGANVFEVGLKEALQSPKFILAKKYILDGLNDIPEDIPCKACAKRKQMAEIGEIIHPLENLFSKSG